MRFIGLLLIFTMSYLNVAKAEVATNNETTKEENGKRITREVIVVTFAGGRTGNIRIKEKIEFLTDEAAQKFSDATAMEDALTAGFLCAVATLPLTSGAGAIVTVLTSTSCAVLLSDTRPRLRKGDFIIEESIGGVAGGVGGYMNTYRVAIGKRDDSYKILYFYSNHHDKPKIETWIKLQLLEFQQPSSAEPLILSVPLSFSSEGAQTN